MPEPLIRNVRNLYTPAGPAARLVSIDDRPPTCTLSYSEIAPGQASVRHIHSWEHEMFIIQGSGTLFCDGKEYPLNEGDAVFLPGNVNHYTLNNGGNGTIKRIEVNPLSAAQGGARVGNEAGAGQDPVIRNVRVLNKETGNLLITSKDGVPTFFVICNQYDPGQVSHDHIHPWEHVGYVFDGHGILVCDGKEYPLTEGDGILLPGNTQHQWRNISQQRMRWVAFNPLVAENG